MSTSPQDKKRFYITTTIPYVNADPHIGFALEIIQADCIARYRQQQGDSIVFNTGTDEHGLKIYRRALEEGKDPQAYVDEYAPKFSALKDALNLSYTHFVRTTDPHHKRAAQEFWKRCLAHSDIYKKEYKVRYCVGCELEKTDSELRDNRCPVHPLLELEIIEEENYFFRFSKYQKQLLEFYDAHPDFVVPDFRFHEIRQFVASGLQDFSISRLAAKMPWGVPVPDDPAHVMYVWFDALVNYISTIGWPEDAGTFSEYWPGMQVAGKDNLRQQTAMWQAMLMSAELPNTKRVMIHGFITVGGQKMSKSLGNVVDPLELVRRYGTDPVRYYLLREIPAHEDGDFSEQKFIERYNGDLANGLGNLVARVATLGERVSPIVGVAADPKFTQEINSVSACYQHAMETFRLHEALAEAWQLIGFLDRYINETKPWEMKDNAELKKVVANAAIVIASLTELIQPFLPGTAERITKQIRIADGAITVRRGEGLFPRI